MSFERSLLSAQGYIELEMLDEALREIEAIPPKDQFREEVLQMRLFIVMRAKRWEQALSICARLRATKPGVRDRLYPRGLLPSRNGPYP